MLNFYIIIGILIWLYIISLLKRANLSGYYFWIGSIGLFLLLSFYVHTYYTWLMSHIITEIIGIMSKLVHSIKIYDMLNEITIQRNNFVVQILITYECSGILEFLAFESLLLFFPIYSKKEKIRLSIVGFSWIVVANILRLLIIIISILIWGPDTIFWTHAIVGRMIFYILIIILFYNVFTKEQILRK